VHTKFAQIESFPRFCPNLTVLIKGRAFSRNIDSLYGKVFPVPMVKHFLYTFFIDLLVG
jgi:hypothetical protein